MPRAVANARMMHRSFFTLLAAVALSASCATPPPVVPEKPPELTFDQKMGWILRLEEDRILELPAPPAPPPVVVPPPSGRGGRHRRSRSPRRHRIQASSRCSPTAKAAFAGVRRWRSAARAWPPASLRLFPY
nr:phytoene/squalene synthase family protein [uncultured bacterium]